MELSGSIENQLKSSNKINLSKINLSKINSSKNKLNRGRKYDQILEEFADLEVRLYKFVNYLQSFHAQNKIIPDYLITMVKIMFNQLTRKAKYLSNSVKNHSDMDWIQIVSDLEDQFKFIY
jgi:hypothetical protein